jgi:hypothetical protein
MFAEDRSDKSQYVANPVMRQNENMAPTVAAATAATSTALAANKINAQPISSSRIDNYKLQVPNFI